MGKKKTGLTFTLQLDDANIDQALFRPPPHFYRDIVPESTELFTLLHQVEKTTGYTVPDGGQCVRACQCLICFHV